MVIRPATPNAPSSLSQKKDTPLTTNKTFESNVRREGVSRTPLHPTPVHKLTEKTNENSNNKVSHGIQAIENENSDLAQVIELLTPIIQSKPLMRSHAPAIPFVPATDFHAHHHQPRSKTKPILKQDRGLKD
ncbi:hypothetical protein TNCV_3927171 [Trichonephila clavipes]|nr:hypothetical protein TNCV_3927171 [Trichonephila clavipes]